MRKEVREPIATWWRIEKYKPSIEPVRVVAFTGSFVTLLAKFWVYSGNDQWQERRERRDDIFPTFDEAKSEFIRRCEGGVEAANNSLQRARSLLGMVESLHPPKDEVTA